jgi:hypothetical protein
MKLQTAANECARRLLASSTAGTDIEEGVTCLKLHYPELIEEYTEQLKERSLHQMMASAFKRMETLDETEGYGQMSIPGLERVPKSIPFISNGTQKFIDSMLATEEHLDSGMGIQQANIDHCVERKAKLFAMKQLIQSQGGGITFGEAVRRANSNAA